MIVAPTWESKSPEVDSMSNFRKKCHESFTLDLKFGSSNCLVTKFKLT